MTKIKTLRDQARVLRTLADSFDIAEIRERLLDLARQCDALAQSLEERPPEDQG
jgi:hypothetical protein